MTNTTHNNLVHYARTQLDQVARRTKSQAEAYHMIRGYRDALGENLGFKANIGVKIFQAINCPLGSAEQNDAYLDLCEYDNQLQEIAKEVI